MVNGPIRTPCGPGRPGALLAALSPSPGQARNQPRETRGRGLGRAGPRTGLGRRGPVQTSSWSGRLKQRHRPGLAGHGLTVESTGFSGDPSRVSMVSGPGGPGPVHPACGPGCPWPRPPDQAEPGQRRRRVDQSGYPSWPVAQVGAVGRAPARRAASYRQLPGETAGQAPPAAAVDRFRSAGRLVPRDPEQGDHDRGPLAEALFPVPRAACTKSDVDAGAGPCLRKEPRAGLGDVPPARCHTARSAAQAVLQRPHAQVGRESG